MSNLNPKPKDPPTLPVLAAKGQKKSTENLEPVKAVHENIIPVRKAGFRKPRLSTTSSSIRTSLKGGRKNDEDDSFLSISESKTAANRHSKAHSKSRHPHDNSTMFNVSSDDFLVRTNNFDGVLWRTRMQNYFKDFFQWPPKTFLGLFWTTGYYGDWAEGKKAGEGDASFKEGPTPKSGRSRSRKQKANDQVSGSSSSRTSTSTATGVTYTRTDGDPEHYHHHQSQEEGADPGRDKKMRRLIFKASQTETLINPKNPKFLKTLRSLGPDFDKLKDAEVTEFLLKVAKDPNWKPTSTASLFSSMPPSSTGVGPASTATNASERGRTRSNSWSDIVQATHKKGSHILMDPAANKEDIASEAGMTPEIKKGMPKMGKNYAKVSPAVAGLNKGNK